MFPRKLIFFRSFGTVVFCTLLFSQCLAQYLPKIQLGIDRLVMNPPKEIVGKRLGLITNPTGIGNNLRSTIDVLFTDNRFELTALFGPEHGVRGDVFAGKKIDDYKDSKTGIPVYSLYGKTRKPTKKMLKNGGFWTKNGQK